MRPDLREKLLDQLVILIDQYLEMRADPDFYSITFHPSALKSGYITKASAAIERVGGARSIYARRAADFLKSSGDDASSAVTHLAGVLEALVADLEAGYVDSAEELIHGELFGDFLEMASYLLDEGYKDPAAVLAGGVLEGHLRQLCKKHGVKAKSRVKGKTKPKKAESMNQDLVKADAYEKLDQKNVTAWLDLRNKAAHGEYGEYNADQVRLMIDAVRDFMTRVRA